MRFRVLAGAIMASAVVASTASAQVVPAGSLCTLPANSYTGSGIATDRSMCSVLDGVTIALEATPRYDSPLLSDDGAGNFYATTGISTSATHVNTGFADWNFDYAIIGAASTQIFRLSIDSDPAVGNVFGDLAHYPGTGDNADSSNLHYWSPTFNPDTPGDYAFELDECANIDCARPLQSVAIVVHVTGTPEPATLGLLATGLVGLGGFVRRRRVQA